MDAPGHAVAIFVLDYLMRGGAQMNFKILCFVIVAVGTFVSTSVFAQLPPSSKPAAQVALQAKADQGDVLAMLQLGRAYGSDPIARYWFQKAADAGSVDGMLELGVSYDKHFDIGPSKEYEQTKAIAWYEKAASAGSLQAEMLLGSLYARPDFLVTTGGRTFTVPADEAKSFSWYEKAATQGDSAAQLGLARLWERTTTQPPNYGQAYVWFSKAAQQGNQDALDALDGMYVYGGQVTSYGEVRDRLVRGSTVGDPDAQWRLGVFYLQPGRHHNLHQAFRWLKASAAQNNAKGIYNLGMAYQYLPVSQGIDMAMIRRSADLGYRKAQLMWAQFNDMDDSGDNEANNDALAMQWRLAAADQGCKDGQEALLHYFQTKAYGPRDGAEAYKWYIIVYGTPSPSSYPPEVTDDEQAEGLRRATAWLAVHNGHREAS